MQINPSIASLFDVFANELQTQFSLGHPNTAVSRSGDGEAQTPPDLMWWSWSLSIDPASRILAGASLEAWRTIAGLDPIASEDDVRNQGVPLWTAAVEQTARSRFGSEVTCAEAVRSDGPGLEWPSIPLTIMRESSPDVEVCFSVSPDLERALGVPADLTPLVKVGMNSAEILMDVEMPVSVSLGRTKMRMKDLLHLTNGSVVELDQELGDEVEIRVNNCVIAYGEVVAADGNYAVRVLRMAPARNTGDPGGTSQARAA